MEKNTIATVEDVVVHSNLAEISYQSDFGMVDDR